MKPTSNIVVHLVPKIDNPSLASPINIIELDFNAIDEQGMAATPEALLKQSLLFSDSSSTVTAAAL